MSVEAISWACRQNVGKSSAKFVLIAMANYADAQGFAWPSLTLLAQVSELDRKTVISAVAWLRERAFLVDTGKKKGGTNSVPVYRLPLESDIQTEPKNGTALSVTETGQEVPKAESVSKPVNGSGTTNGAVPLFPKSSPKFPHKQSQKRDTEPSRTIREPSNKSTRPDGVDEKLWADFLVIRKAKRAPVTETAIAGIRREAQRAGMDLNAAIATCCERGWIGFKADWVARDAIRHPAAKPPTAPMGTKNYREGVTEDGCIH